ncbi:reverse transcriptase domain-containing protein [Tanacetum coccineum]
MCIDFKNLNSSCPKDYYPLPEIDSKIEAVMGYPLKCFLDAYKGYHQVQMSEEDEEKTAFYTDQGTFCYKKMPFGLKNAGATYQRLVDEAFDKQIGQNLEVYVDDMVIKSKRAKELNLPLKSLALVAQEMKSRRLRRYFEAHPITVITDQPIKQILGKAEASGHLTQYAVELGAYKITYEPRNSIKGQVLADFLNEIPVGYNALVPREMTYTPGDQKTAP